MTLCAGLLAFSKPVVQRTTFILEFEVPCGTPQTTRFGSGRRNALNIRINFSSFPPLQVFSPANNNRSIRKIQSKSQRPGIPGMRKKALKWFTKYRLFSNRSFITFMPILWLQGFVNFLERTNILPQPFMRRELMNGTS